MTERFTVGDFCFRLSWPEELALPENFFKFRGGQQESYHYVLRLSESFPPPEGRTLARREDLLVTTAPGGERRYIGVKGNPAPYACCTEMDERTAEILLDPCRTDMLRFDPGFLSLLALERHELPLGGVVLHCAYIECGGEAILFSAPSGTGKSTQAGLWERYRGARTVNGDRALLQKRAGRWFARGWPVCGSSGVCLREDFPIRAIVTLEQSQADKAEYAAPGRAFTRVLSQLTVNRWDPAAYVHALDLAESLVREVPVIHLACTISEAAVRTLAISLNAPRPDCFTNNTGEEK